MHRPSTGEARPGTSRPVTANGSLSHRPKNFRTRETSIEVGGEISYILKGWSKVLGPNSVDSKVMSLFGNLWQIRVLPYGDHLVQSSDAIGIILVNRSERPVRASYSITLKNQCGVGSDITWTDPDGEVLFGTPDTGDNYWGCDEFIPRNKLENHDAGFLLDDSLHFVVHITARNRDVLGALTRITASPEDGGGQTNGSSLEAASDELQELSTIMKQKVRLLSEDALLQDELIRVRLGDS